MVALQGQEAVVKEPLWIKRMNKNLLIIFARNPELGKCKTRLAKTVGNDNAFKIYKILLQHTLALTKQLRSDKAVYYSVQIIENDIWDKNIYQKFQQEGKDIGLRMLHAFKNSFQSGYEKVVIIGSDILDLKQQHIEAAFTALKYNDVVLGPAEDGGYYLLGMNKLYPAIFHNKKWGTRTVRYDTLNDLKNKKVILLEMLNDIDIYSDIKDHHDLKPYLINETTDTRNS